MIKKIIICLLTISIWFSLIFTSFAEEISKSSQEQGSDQTLNSISAQSTIQSETEIAIPFDTLNLPEKIIPTEASDPSKTQDSAQTIISSESSISEPDPQIPPPINAVLKNNEDKEPIKGNGFRLQADASTGALIMEYPIQIPPGRSGLEPDLSLIYNSQNNDNDNIFGYGWSINIPYIERLNKKGADKLYSNNFFSSSLSGELTNVSIINGQYGNYAAKIDDGDFLNYEYLSDNSWKITDKGGMIYKFGLNSLSRQDDPQNPEKVYKWMLQEVRDPNDNFIKYEYLKEDGQIYPLKIQYTGYSKADGIFTIEFSKKLRSDVIIDYKSGFEVINVYLISEIKIKNKNESWSHKYILNYLPGENGYRSLLNKIEIVGNDGSKETKLIPETIEYQKNLPGIGKKWIEYGKDIIPVDLYDGYNESSGARIFDVNGDALPDIVFAKKGSNKVTYVNYPSGDKNLWKAAADYNSPVDFVDESGEDLFVRIGDVNGDLLEDLIFIPNQNPESEYFGNVLIKSHYSVTVYINNGKSWVKNSNYKLTTKVLKLQGNKIDLLDVNGDGLADIVSGSAVFLNNADGKGWADGCYDIDICFTIYKEGSFADVNGDNLVDIIYSPPDMVDAAVYINTGKGWSKSGSYYIPIPFFTQNGSDNGVRLDDANGDGLIDIFYAREDDWNNRAVYINKGYVIGWEKDPEFKIPEPFISYYYEGLGYILKSQVNNGVRLADIDGDGLTDFLYRNDKRSKNVVYRNFSKVPDLLIKFFNKMGGEFSAFYMATPKYVKANQLLNPKLPIKLQALLNTNWYDTINKSFSNGVNYEYSNGEYYYKNELDKNFAGFNVVREEDYFDNIKKTYYHQGNTSDVLSGEYNDHPSKIGLVYAIENFDQNNNLYSKEFNLWENVLLANERNFVKLIQTINSIFDGDTSFRSKAEKYSYDDTNGNIIQKILMGEVQSSNLGEIIKDVGNDKYTVDLSYASNNSGKLSDLVSQEIVKNQSGVKVKESKFYYDNLEFGKMNKGNLTKEELWKDGSNYISSGKSYNVYGLPVEETDANGNKTSYQYDAYNLYPIKIVNPLNQFESYTYDYSSGKVKQYTDFNGLKFENVYDVFDRLIDKKVPDINNPLNLVSQLQYEYIDYVFPNYLREQKKLDSSGKGPLQFIYFDGLGRIIQTRKELGNESVFSTKDFKYNQVGLIEKESLSYASSWGAITPINVNDNLFIKYVYDPLNRIKTIQNALGTATYTYDDWKTSVKDANGNLKDFFNNAYDNLVKVQEYNEGSIYKTEYEYNVFDQITKIIDALGNIRNFTYDSLGRQLTAEDLHSPSDSTFGKFFFSYDNNGNLINQTDANGQTTNFTYDKLSRILSEDFVGQAGVETSYVYDNCTSGIGRICSVTEGNLSSKYNYDSLGNMISENKKVDSKEYLTKFTYDLQSNLLSLTYPDNALVNYAYNSAGFLKSIKQNGKGIIKNISYNAIEQPETIEYGNGTVTKNTFDSQKLYRLVNKSTELLTKKLQNIAYTFDAVGNISKIVDSSPFKISKTANYSYDNLYRLKSANITNAGNNQNYSESYSYNAIGNITLKTGQGNYSYAGNSGSSFANPHAVTSIGSKIFAYDKNGNITSDGKQNFKWDYKDRLIEATAPGKSIKYLYDYTGERVKKSDGLNWTIYVNQFYEIRNDKIIKHVYADDENLASIEVGNVAGGGMSDIMLEDAEDGDVLGWKSYVSTYSAKNVYDDVKKSKVILLSSNGGFELNNEDGTMFNNTTHKSFSFDFNSANDFDVRLVIDTDKGPKYLIYSSLISGNKMTTNSYYIKIDASLKDGKWHTLKRNLQADLGLFDANVKLTKIKYLMTYPYNKPLKLDNIKLMGGVGGPVQLVKTIFHHTDHLSGTNIETDENGNVIEITDYYPYGEVRVDESLDGSGAVTSFGYKNPYKFTGKELDADIGLYYYGARYYNPTIGRFVSQDPWEGDIKDPQSLNKYSYVINNPLKYVDPTGESWYDSLVDGYNLVKKKASDVIDYVSDLVKPKSADASTFSNTNDHSNFESGIINESGNPKQYDFSRITDTDDIIGAGITLGLGSKIRTLGEILGLIKKETHSLNKNQNTEKISPNELLPTDTPGLGRIGWFEKHLQKFGFRQKDPIKYFKYKGDKYIVDGHHRTQAAKNLRINVYAKKVGKNYFKQRWGTTTKDFIKVIKNFNKAKK